MPKFNPDTDIPSLEGKIAIVTGGNRGMGYHITAELSNHGAKVYLAARSKSSAEAAIAKIEKEQEDAGLKDVGPIVFLDLDLSSIKGAKASAEAYLQQETTLNIIVHNAGLMAHDYGKTKDGIEDTFAVNHLAPFVFTQTLFETLVATSKKANSDVRVVIVGSSVHNLAPPGGKFLTLDEINDPLAPAKTMNNRKAKYARYGRTKLANMLYAKTLQKKFDEASSNAIAISLHPGGVATETVLKEFSAIPWIGWLLAGLINLLAMTPAQGALTALFAATSDKVRMQVEEFKGKYIVPYGTITKPSCADGGDDALADKLWEATKKITDEVLARP